MGRKSTLTNFTMLKNNGCFEINTYQCNCCGHIFEYNHKQIMKRKKACPKCGNYYGCKVNPYLILQTCKPIDNSNFLFIDKKGSVYSINGKFKVLKLNYKKGYNFVIVNGIKKAVHHLVLESWGFPRPSEKHICCHINDIRNDNRLENLKWDIHLVNTQQKESNDNIRKETIIKAFKNGLSVDDICIIGKLRKDIVESLIKTL